MGKQFLIVLDRSRPSSVKISAYRLLIKTEVPFNACYPPVPTPYKTNPPTSAYNTTRISEQFETGEPVTRAALRARKGWCHFAKVLVGTAEISHSELYELTSPRITTITLFGPNSVLEALSKIALELDELSSKNHHRLYMIIALRIAETPRVARAQRRTGSTVRGEMRVPLSVVFGDATLSRVGDFGASAKTNVLKGSTSIITAEGEPAFATQSVGFVVDKEIHRRSIPTLRPKGELVLGKETLTLFVGFQW